MGSSNRYGLTVVAVLGLLAARPAAAQDFVYYNVCGVADGTTLRICASADLSLDGSTLRMRVWNMEVAGATGSGSYGSEFGGWHTITSVGLEYTGAGDAGNGTFSGARYIFGTGVGDFLSLTRWDDIEGGRNPLQVQTGSSTSGHREGIVGCTDPGPSNAGHVSTCTSYGFMPYVEFTFTGVDTNLDFASYHFEFHGQQMLNGQSAKGVGPGTPPGEVVPEPLTMVLLGSGLAGIGGVTWRRRRRESDVRPSDA